MHTTPPPPPTSAPTINSTIDELLIVPNSSHFNHSIQTIPPETPAQESKRAVYDACVSGAQDPPQIPHLHSDPAPSYHPLPRSLAEFRELEGREYRKARLHALWKQLPAALDPKGTRSDALPRLVGGATLTPEGASKMREVYERELMESCADSPGHNGWKKFKSMPKAKKPVSPRHSPSLFAWLINASTFNIKSYGISSTTNWTWTAMAIWTARS